MKKLLLLAIVALTATAITVNAQDASTKKKGRTPEQKVLWKEMLQKYDTNGDKKLDKEEIAKISKEDKDKLDKAGIKLTREAKKKKKDTQ